MADDRRKMLEALAAKRKAESLAPTRHAKPKPKPSLPSKPVVKSGGEKPKIKPSSFSLKETPKKKKRVEKYESEGSSEEDNDDGLSSESDAGSGDDSDMEIVKKPVKNFLKPSKGQVPLKHEAKGSKSVRTGVNEKGREDPNSKSVIKEKAKGRKKGDSSDEGVSDEDDGGDLSNDSGDQVDPSNILPGRTRRRSTQPVQYDFGNVSDEDDDSDD